MPTTTDLLGLAVDKNPVDFADTFNQIMMQKAQDAIEAKRVELAQAIYGESEEPDLDDDVGEDEFDLDDDDLDLDLDDDLDDEDVDFDDVDDDLDLDDIDLEDLTDDEDA